jgi:hypothetical protein
MGPACFWHHRGEWPSPHWLEWGGSDRLSSAELRRSKFVAKLSSTGGPHPDGWDVVEVAFSLADDKFRELRKAFSRCFEGFSWFGETIAEPDAAPNVGPGTLLVIRESPKGPPSVS